MSAAAPLVQVDDIQKYFPLTRSLTETIRRHAKLAIRAVDGVSFVVGAGETLGLIGESGSGKTTIGWLMSRLHEPTGGRILFEGEDVAHLQGAKLRAWRRNVQVVFQDPVGSLDPRMRVWEIVSEPIRAQEPGLRRIELRRRVAELLPTVGLMPEILDQYPHEFSGGGRQRISLARALSLRPKLIVLDEPTSALDVAVQAQILNRLVSLQSEFGFAYLMITHNVSAVKYVADRVAVLYLGKLAEIGTVREVLEHPTHPYTKALLAALPVPDVRRRHARYRISGEIPTLIRPPPGCRFATRCPFVIDRCRVEEPLLRSIGKDPTHLAACHRAEEVVDIPPETLMAMEASGAPSPIAPGSHLVGTTAP